MAANGLARSVGLCDDLLAATPADTNYRRTLATALLDLAEVRLQQGWFDDAETSASKSADLFRDLLKGPVSPHRYDRLFLAVAKSWQAEAAREAGRRDAALAAHVAAFREFQTIFKEPQTPGRRRRSERATLLLPSIGSSRPNVCAMANRRDRAERDFTHAIDIWADLQRAAPRTPFYRDWQAVAYLSRGRLRAESDQPPQQSLAATDLDRSRAILEVLVSASPAVPRYQVHLGQAYAALSRLAARRNDKSDAARWSSRAAAAFRAALARSPDAEPLKKLLAAVEASRTGE